MIEIIRTDADYGLPKDYAEFGVKFDATQENAEELTEESSEEIKPLKSKNARFSWEHIK